MFGLALHGGAGTLPRTESHSDKRRHYEAGLAQALETGYALLAGGASSTEAVCATVSALEDNPLFNAGRGAVFTHDGRNELDASLMEGRQLKAGAVCGVMHIKNPVQLARAVMERSDHVMLAGSGAEEFALQSGFGLVPQSYFFTEERWKQLERIRGGDKNVSPFTISHLGTVGAVALDRHGNVAAATSTGGMTGKRFARIGDSPLIGAGTWADNRSCAVSCTGHGEIFIRTGVAHDIAARMRFGSANLKDAVHTVVHEELRRLRGEGGVIAIDAAGHIVMDFNSEGMFRASRREGEEPYVAIYRDEA